MQSILITFLSLNYFKHNRWIWYSGKQTICNKSLIHADTQGFQYGKYISFKTDWEQEGYECIVYIDSFFSLYV